MICNQPLRPALVLSSGYQVAILGIKLFRCRGEGEGSNQTRQFAVIEAALVGGLIAIINLTALIKTLTVYSWWCCPAAQPITGFIFGNKQIYFIG